MDKNNGLRVRFGQFLTRMGIGLRTKLIIIFITVQILPLLLLTVIAWQQIQVLGEILREKAVEDASQALNDSAVENIERMSTDTARQVADFLYARDDDILYLAAMEPSLDAYRQFSESQLGQIIDRDEWVLAEDGLSWVPANPAEPVESTVVSTNPENDDRNGFRYREPDNHTSTRVPLYDEITFVGLDGVERFKYVSPDSTKTRYPMNPALQDVSRPENTYIKAETYFEALQNMEPGEIYVSDVIGAYVGTNYIGMYTPDIVGAAAEDRGYDIAYAPEQQAYAGEENPNGQRFEGIIRWATPVADAGGEVIGYVTFALNHDHIMEFVDHLTPMNERYTQLPSAYEGNYAFIWDYQCRSICHPRHHSIVGYDPETGNPEIPWLESSIYEGWQESGVEDWTEYVADIPEFFEQSRSKSAAPQLTQAGLVGLDGRYLNNAPQCTGWMDLTAEGGSGSFYILWSGLYKLNTAAAIPYYTGQYAPSADNGYSRRGFGFVAIGSDLDDFTRPATEMEGRLTEIIKSSEGDTAQQLILTTGIIMVLVVLIAIGVAYSITGKLHMLLAGISRFRAGERQFRYHEPVKDEFGILADSFDDMADSIVNSVNHPLSIIDADRNIIYMNDAGLEFCQKSLDEIVGTDYSINSVYPSDSVYDPIQALHEGREAEVFYVEHSQRYLKGTASYLYDKDGFRNGYTIETTDLTDMILGQIHVEEQKALLDTVFTASPDLIWYMDAEGAYLTVNPRFASLSGQEAGAFPGKKAEEMLPPDIAESFAENDRKAIMQSKPFYAEEHLRFADGHTEILDSVRTPIYDMHGTLMGLLGFGRNVTIRYEMEGELRQTQKELEEAVMEANLANEHKGTFLARMSHEIRTPMNAIIGLTNLVQRKLQGIRVDSADMAEVNNYMDQIEDSSQHLLGLLNDILDLTKIEAGRIELSEEVMELSRLADTVSSIIQSRCDDKNINFINNFDNFDPPAFNVDSLRLRQVLINLLGNAVKFTPELGTIEFSMLKRDKLGDKVLVEFIVRDTGIGIAEENLGQIFESFEQGSADVARIHGGTGLGLAISKRIVQLFGGDIKLESKLGEGSTFSFAIWLQESAEQQQQQVQISDPSGKFTGRRVLMADDVQINRMILRSLLEEMGIIVDEAANGQEALDAFAASSPDYYDLIMMDVQMPVMNGYEASLAIRDLDRPDARRIPIIAQTANAFKEDIDKALANKMNGHLAKPVEMDALLEILFKYLG